MNYAYEYKIVNIGKPDTDGRASTETEALLNVYGSQGWRVVLALSMTSLLLNRTVNE